METKTIVIHPSGAWEKERTITLVRKWGIVHAKSRIKTPGNNFMYATEAACKKGCKDTKKNNSKEVFDRFFPEGVDAAPFWCYEHGDIHSADFPAPPTLIRIRKNKKSGNYQWSIYEVCQPDHWMNEGGPNLEEIKAEVLEVFPRAIFEEV